MDSGPGDDEYDKHIDALEKALKEIRDSTHKSSIILRAIAARALELRRP